MRITGPYQRSGGNQYRRRGRLAPANDPPRQADSAPDRPHSPWWSQYRWAMRTPVAALLALALLAGACSPTPPTASDQGSGAPSSDGASPSGLSASPTTRPSPTATPVAL